VKKIIIICLAVFYLLGFSEASAHSTVYDKSIGALFHVDPQDSPIVKEPAELYFHFLDKEEKFKKDLCLCTVTISENGKKLLSESFGAVDIKKYGSNTGHTTFIFPEKNVYEIIVAGKAKGGEFPDFNLKYDLRVERENTTNKTINYYAYVIPISAIFVILLIIIIKKLIKKKKHV